MKKEILLGLAVLGVSSFAFSFKVRRAIGERDNWTCQEQGCGRSFRDGWMVQAAHYDHSRKNPKYDDPSNGRILCTEHHVTDEMRHGHTNAVRALRNTQTVRTFSWLQKHKR